MRFFSSVWFLCILLIFPMKAHAWGAMAASSPSNYSHTSTGYDTKAAAEQAAMANCEQRSGEACKLMLGGARHGGAFVTYQGDKGKGFGYDVDPVKANAKAQAACRDDFKNCRIVDAVWDEGGMWMAYAIGKDDRYLAYNFREKSGAESEAIQGCEKAVSEKGTCRLHEPFTRFGKIYNAEAYSEKASFVHHAISGESQKVADSVALRGCAEHPSRPDDCVVRERFINEGPKPAPKSMQKLVASIKKIAPTPSSRPVAQMSSYSCETNCVNNNCVSSFPDGRVIKWIAPNVFEFGKWKVDTDGCGLK